MIMLEYEMTYRETIQGPLGSTVGSPLGERLCWQVTTATLRGPRISATASVPHLRNPSRQPASCVRDDLCSWGVRSPSRLSADDGRDVLLLAGSSAIKRFRQSRRSSPRTG